MSALSREVDAVQNAAFASVLLWRFSAAYAVVRQAPATTPVPVLFVVLPLLFDEDTANMVASTQRASGLRLFAGKFAESKHAKTDVLLSLESRAKALRPQTLEAVTLALKARLLFLDPASGEVVALSHAPALSLPESVRPLVRSAEKLGAWSGALSLFELSTTLQVTF
ncbi:MAG: three component ABC system middle component [Vicinamibacterales bacterium]